MGRYYPGDIARQSSDMSPTAWPCMRPAAIRAELWSSERHFNAKGPGELTAICVIRLDNRALGPVDSLGDIIERGET